MLTCLAAMEKVTLQGGGSLLEHPADPDEEPYASVWVTEEVRGTEERAGWVRRLVDQCMFDSAAKKPTCSSGLC